jgi:hypothetical protein
MTSSAWPGDAATPRQPVSRQHAGMLSMFAVRAISPFRDHGPELQPTSAPVTGRQADENMPFSRHDNLPPAGPGKQR